MSKSGERHPYRRPVSFVLDIRRTDHRELYEKLEQGYNKSEYARQLLMEALDVKPGTGVAVVEVEQPKKEAPPPQKPVAREAAQPAVRQQGTSDSKSQQPRTSKSQGGASRLSLGNLGLRSSRQ